MSQEVAISVYFMEDGLENGLENHFAFHIAEETLIIITVTSISRVPYIRDTHHRLCNIQTVGHSKHSTYFSC